MRFYVCCMAICLLLSPCGASANQIQKIPADYIIAGNLNHELGQRWLKARSLKSQGEFEQSRIQYILLLDSYPDLIQARYEYVEVLEVLGRVKEVEVELEILLEFDPENLDYKQALGTLFLVNGQEKQGLILLNEVWTVREKSSLGHLLYRTYSQKGLKGKSLPVLEILYRQSPDDLYLQDELFTLYLALNDDVKAQNFAPPLTENSPASLQRFIQAAHLHKRLGLEHIAADYWQAVLKKQPDFVPAHESLALYYTENSRANEALPHKIFLYNQSDDDGQIAGEIGDYFVQVNECEQAVFFLRRSLASEQHQLERIKSLAYCYQQIGAMDDAAQFFSTYLELQDSPQVEDRLAAAKMYVAVGQDQAAAEQFKALLVHKPGELDLLVALAQAETARGDYAEALTVWKQVAERKPDDLDSRVQILSLSEKLGEEDVYTVLNEIHGLDQNNHRVSLLLALAAFEHGNMEQGWKLFRPIATSELFSADLLTLRGEIFLVLNKSEHSFLDFGESFKKNEHQQHKDVLSYLQVAGDLGRLDIVQELSQTYHLSEATDPNSLLVYADALAECGDLPGAVKRYTQVIEGENTRWASKARYGLAQFYTRHGFLFEAEQENRINWLVHKNTKALLAMVRAALQQGENGDAEYWLDQYTLSTKGFDPLVYLADMQLLMAYGEPEQALRMADEFSQSCLAAGVDCTSSEMLIALEQSEVLFWEDQLLVAQNIIQLQGKKYPESFLPQVYGLKWVDLLAPPREVSFLEDKLLQDASGDVGDLYVLQVATKTHGLSNFTTQINRKLHKEHPRSLKYGLSLLASLLEKSSFDEALNVISRLQEVYPDSLLLHLYGARVNLATGAFNKGMASIAEGLDAFAVYELELLRARFLWGMSKWDDALRMYEKNMTPKADVLFVQQIDALHLELPASPDPSLWGRVVKPLGQKQTPLERSFLMISDESPGAVSIAKIGMSFFAQKMWQDYFSREHSARKSIRNREFFHAVNQYEAMADSLDEPSLLFDLAGVYSSLNRVGDEAVVYEDIQDINPDFPGLSQAMNRNQLKRRPRTGVRLSYFEEKGRDGYKDIKQWQQGVHGWYSPKPRTEVFVAVDHRYYSDDTSGNTIHGNEMLLGVTSDVFDYFRIDLSGGVHLLNGDDPDKGVFELSITGTANDYLKSYVGIKRRVVKDTIASLSRGITVEEYTAQATIDLFPRFQVGGKLSRIDYSDDNEMNGYSVWGTLILQPEPHFLYFRGGYEFMDHKDGAGGAGVLLVDGFREDDHPYWSPVNYWCNQYTLGYRYSSKNLLGHQVPASFSALYSAEYDSDGELLHHFATRMHIEITEAWIFSVDSSADFSDEFHGYHLDGSLEYRW